MIAIRTPEAGDVIELALNMRDADVAECEAAGLSPVAALRQSVAQSVYVRTLLFDNAVAAMWGVVPIESSLMSGQLWLLTGIGADEHKKDFVRLYRRELARLRTEWKELVNIVDARHSAALRLASSSGFEVLSEPVAVGPNSLPFFKIRIGGAHA